MLWSQLALATTAFGVLIPTPNAASSDEGIFRALPISTDSFGLPAIALEQSVDVPCAQCKGKNTNLKLDFAVENGRSLMCNGFELYPSADPWHGDLVAPLIKGHGKSHGKNKIQRLGYSLAVKAQAMDEEQQMGIISVDLRVIEVGDRFVEGVPHVVVKLIQAPTGEILIGNIEIADSDKSAKCNTVWCQTKDVLDDAFRKVKECGGRLGHKGPGKEATRPVDAHKPASHHGHHDHHDHHAMDQDDYDWGKLLENVVAHIIFPVLMGITAGVGVATVAMIVASIFVRLTALFKRKQSWTEQRPSKNEAGTFEEKVSFVEAIESEPLPPADKISN